MALRRLLAALLVVAAALLALGPRGAPAGTGVVVAARDLGAGTAVAPVDLTVREWPDDLVPAGAVTDPAAASGRLLVGGVRAGEPVTDVRLLGPEAARVSAGHDDAAGVPLRLADPGVGALLHPGVRVDVVAVGGSAGSGGSGGSGTGATGAGATDAGRDGAGGAGTGAAVPGEAGEAGGVVAAGAVVLAVLAAPERSVTGPVVVVALPSDDAARVAATSLSREVTVTLR